MRHLRRKWTFRIGGASHVLVKKSGERGEHVLMKALMAQLYAARYPSLKIEVRLQGESKYKPDVIAVNRFGEAIFWGECGSVGETKLAYLLKHYRNTHLAISKWNTTLKPFKEMIESNWPKNNRYAPVELIRFDDNARGNIEPDGEVQISWQEIRTVRWEPDGSKK